MKGAACLFASEKHQNALPPVGPAPGSYRPEAAKPRSLTSTPEFGTNTLGSNAINHLGSANAAPYREPPKKQISYHSFSQSDHVLRISTLLAIGGIPVTLR